MGLTGRDLPHAAVYAGAAGRVAALLADRPAAAAGPVPACPGWRVADLIAHLAEVCVSALGTPPPPRAGTADLARWWAAAASAGAGPVADRGHRAGPLVLDAFCHELDLRQALGLPPPDHDPVHDPAYELVLGIATGGLSTSLDRLGLPGLVVVDPVSGDRTAGSRPPAATVSAGRHDLLRTLTGRRTEAQVAALDWTADPDPFLPAFRWGPFTPPSRPVE